MVSLPIVLLLVSSGVVLQHPSLLSSTSKLTVIETTTESDTQYITRLETVQATTTLYVFNHSSTIYLPPQTVTTTVETTTTVTANRTIEVEQSNLANFILAGGQYGTWFTPSQYP